LTLAFDGDRDSSSDEEQYIFIYHFEGDEEYEPDVIEDDEPDEEPAPEQSKQRPQRKQRPRYINQRQTKKLRKMRVNYG
jgi:hypothetical protein